MKVKAKFRLRYAERIILIFKILTLVLVSLLPAYTFGLIIFDGIFSLQALSLATKNSNRVLGAQEFVEVIKEKPYRALYPLIDSSNLFGKLKNPADGIKSTTSQPVVESKLALILVGTFVAFPSNGSYAIIENKDKREQDIFNIGDTVFNSAELKEISSNSVTIERDGKREILRIDLELGEGGSSAPTELSAGQDLVEIDQSAVAEALDNLPILLTQARTVPYFANGQRAGLRLFAIRSGSFFEKIKLMNGDILKEINGNELNDPANALELFQKLKTERSITVKLVRNREEKVVRYEIR
jgi:general secretion pathway protein C